MKHYLLDTNILIYYFNGNMECAVKDKVSKLIRESFQISIISKMEFLGFPFNLQERQKAEQFVECATIRSLSDEIVQHVIDIRKGKSIKLPDAIIAATAVQYSAILVTRNTKDFKALALETYNPFDGD
ncbi:type II toxin-antitoxin system VapC family toxin [Methylobacter sp.]|uniref:type II toxin-antitoxin system VapC family toxin n=1 Tax=Methylobacter sp. TaxID=2051955 RepID=UPI002489503A|nr:type II toxin-antitoxin system VapC family toxin [Methylobacter sp.]MDI1276337.1 type II toxin-antitoxin system VapC family toxin [Methylobacter sp.]MDI1357077.1 type II toxin-antitoxin system VapC family toxin [Methylobacter sp.]